MFDSVGWLSSFLKQEIVNVSMFMSLFVSHSLILPIEKRKRHIGQDMTMGLILSARPIYKSNFYYLHAYTYIPYFLRKAKTLTV